MFSNRKRSLVNLDLKIFQIFDLKKKIKSTKIFGNLYEKINYLLLYKTITELSMGRLDQARTRKCKPESGPNPKIIKNCK